MEFCFAEDGGLFAVTQLMSMSDYRYGVWSEALAPHGPLHPYLLVDQAVDWDGTNTYVTYEML